MWRAAARRLGATAPSASTTWSFASSLIAFEQGLLGACHKAAVGVTFLTTEPVNKEGSGRS